MSNTSMTLSEELRWRGQVKDTTFDNLAWLDINPDQPVRTFYLGADCSSDSLTVGNLAIFMLARRLRQHGWKAVLLVGGATSLIGDPGGKDEERTLKSHQEIEHNVAGIKHQVAQIFSGLDFTPVNNYDWFKDIGYLEFLRDVGKYYSMTELIQRDYIATRLGDGGSGISYAEFSYNLIQGYDYWHLFKHHNVTLQIGGSDQWGNMLSGVPLIRKKEGAEVQAMSMPLIIDKNTGKKFGKSEAGAIWLDGAKTTPFQFYQFWFNTDDDDVEEFLKIYTDIDQPRLESLMAEQQSNPGQRPAQKQLALAVTALIHGQATAEAVRDASQVLFGSASYQTLTADALKQLSGELLTIKAHDNEPLYETLVRAGLAASNGEARRFIADGAVYINGQQSAADKSGLDDSDNLHGYAVLRRGKNSTALVNFK